MKIQYEACSSCIVPCGWTLEGAKEEAVLKLRYRPVGAPQDQAQLDQPQL